jgi:hypothetical protein
MGFILSMYAMLLPLFFFDFNDSLSTSRDEKRPFLIQGGLERHQMESINAGYSHFDP